MSKICKRFITVFTTIPREEPVGRCRLVTSNTNYLEVRYPEFGNLVFGTALQFNVDAGVYSPCMQGMHCMPRNFIKKIIIYKKKKNSLKKNSQSIKILMILC